MVGIVCELTLSRTVTVRRVVDTTSVEQASGGPLGACGAVPRKTHLLSSCLALGLSLNHSYQKKHKQSV